eukprot:TRINITY_DN1632_c0_g4_i1.p1 TRINITY_DN1632_c0_g4~~TRINITY_DN1632_c0_g4_i1.p1  ORF type:complete len:461 (+),score=129.85 TRINITY_DN1632_c0_g4_i1:71-1384(+)
MAENEDSDDCGGSLEIDIEKTAALAAKDDNGNGNNGGGGGGCDDDAAAMAAAPAAGNWAPPNEEERRQVEVIRKAVLASGAKTLMPDSLLVGYVRDHPTDLTTATALAKESALFRDIMQPQQIKINDVAPVLRKYEIWSGGFGKNGGPITWLENFSAHSMQHDFTIPMLQTFAFIGERSLAQGLHRMNFILNLHNISTKNVDDRLVRTAMQLIETNYPDSLGDLIVFNVPSWIKVLYSMVSPWLPTKWRSRLLVIKSDLKLLQNRIEPKYLPQRYGGTVPNSESCTSWFIQQCSKEQGVDLLAPPAHVVPPRVYLAFANELPLTKKPVPCKQLPNQIMSGSLKKVGGIVKLWKTYHCILHAAGALLYFKNESESHPVGSILLDTARMEETVKGKSKQFALICLTRTYWFSCKNDKVKDLWCQALKKVCGKPLAAPFT